MIPLIRAELLKARASRTTRVLVAVTPLFCALWACLPALMPAASDAVRMANVYNMAQQAYVFTMIIGILGMCGEFRHGTITWSFLASPRRGRVVLAKLAVYGLVGLVVSALSALATLVAGAALLSSQGHPALSADVPWVLTGAVLGSTLYALLGVGLGALIRHQVGAIALACLLFMYGDAFLAWLVPDVFRWLPTGAARALGGMRLDSGGELLPAWGGGLLFAGYIAAAVLAARFITLRRDITG
ncbi:ABC transporter permease [Nonomuraea harbinensis]|uniref:ABC transporter permease n=1 Tax=Nonomuraea harbinensis TaxID=1286938 RepID=A0ABW1BNH8_9ACTN|nr:ABC transporter permease [Nonomuraea harbinensis]